MNPLNRFAIFLTVIIFISAACVKNSQAASFNCSIKHSVLEILICADPDLSAMDSKESETYFQLKSVTPNAQKSSLLTAHRKFLQERLRACPIPFKPSLSDDDTKQIITCLKGNYSLRINVLKKELAAYQVNPPSGITSPTKTVSPPASQSALPQCDQSMTAKNYYLASCIAHGMEITRQGTDLASAERKMYDERKQIDCSPDSLDRVHAAANSAAERIVSAGAISSLMDFGDAIALECNKAAAIQWVKDQAKQQVDAALFPKIKMQAEQGDKDAQNKLGTLYSYGDGTPQDYTEACKWFRKSADQGYAKAQYNLGQSYRQGKGITQDNSEAIKLYRMSADQGYAAAQVALGMMYSNGLGVVQDNAKAVEWLQKAADQGYAPAQVKLGAAYAEGTAVTQNYVEAVKWWRKAAEQGDAEAQYLLGSSYYIGQGVTLDKAIAVEWLNKSAEQGNAAAKHNLDLIGAQNWVPPDKNMQAATFYHYQNGKYINADM